MNQEAMKKRRAAADIKKKRAAQLAGAERRVLDAALGWWGTVHLRPEGAMAALATRHDAEIELDIAVQTWRALR